MPFRAGYTGYIWRRIGWEDILEVKPRLCPKDIHKNQIFLSRRFALCVLLLGEHLDVKGHLPSVTLCALCLQLWQLFFSLHATDESYAVMEKHKGKWSMTPKIFPTKPKCLFFFGWWSCCHSLQ